MSDTEILKDESWQIRFVRHGDRWAHTIGAVVGKRLVPLLASIEGAENELWPPSPPLKDFHLHSAGGTTTAMLVGMAGNSHWSATVELAQGDKSVNFDVACRIKDNLPDAAEAEKRISSLCSAYRAMVCPTRESNQAALLVLDDLSVRITADQKKGSEGSPATTIATGESSLEIIASPDEDSLPRTVRWHYCLTRTDMERQSALE